MRYWNRYESGGVVTQIESKSNFKLNSVEVFCEIDAQESEVKYTIRI